MTSLTIFTEAHGLRPSPAQPDPDQARIAFVEPVPGQCIRAQRHFNDTLLIIKASDAGYAQFGFFSQLGLAMGAQLDLRYKRWFLAQSTQDAYPFAPMCLSDALAVVDFIQSVQDKGLAQLVISCEYGQSRSVTTAHVLSAFLDRQDMPERTINQYVRDLLIKALKKRHPQDFQAD